MILDRSPEEEPLIPAEKTRIRLEMARKKRRLWESNKGGYECDYDSGSEPFVGYCTEWNEGKDSRK